MKKTGVCPKCGCKDVKENQLGGMNAMWAGRIYRCEDCGFSEIWSTKQHRRQLNVLLGLIILLPLIMIGFMMWTVG
ncbi:MAG: hypothetical protein VXX77_01300 [Candidatus Thermoplasmatota archaeon]|nr:hypothetical protein [Candidatus Thermoplasmatota archaeon]